MISCMEIRASPSVKGAVGATLTSGPSIPVRESSKYRGCDQELAWHTSPFPGKQRDRCAGNGGREGRVVGDELREVTEVMNVVGIIMVPQGCLYTNPWKL